MGNKSQKILKGIRGAFIGFRWLFTLSLIGIVYQFVAGPATLIGTVQLAPDTTTFLKNSGAPDASLHVDGLKADVKVPVGPAADAELKTVARLATLPWMLVAAGAGLVLCEIAQRLLRNLETGEMFSDRNVKLLRIFAMVLIVATVLVRVLEGWGNHVFGQYAAAHLAVAGARPLAVADHVAIAEMQLDLSNADLLVALLLVLIVWAFKEGAALKHDSELTI
jgi:hypothetical protein